MTIRTPERMALVSYCVSLVSLVFVVAASYAISVQQLHTTKWVERGKRVLESLDRIEQLVLDTEASARAFRSIGDPFFSDRCYTLIGTLRTEVEKTRGLVNDASTSRSLMDQVRQRVDQRIARAIAVVSQGRIAAPHGPTATAGRPDEMRRLLDRLRKNESDLFDERVRERNEGLRAAWTLLALAVIVGTVLLTWTHRQIKVANAARQGAEQHARHLALHDPLTGLCNRRVLDEHLALEIAAAGRHGHLLALMFIDLDGFKAVNDRWGHQHGDEVLKEVAQRLRHNVRKEDLTVRLGGDEFAVAFSRLHSTEEASFLAQKLIDVLSRPYSIDEDTSHLSASIGLAMFPEHGATVSQLIKAADQAVYEAKSAGKKRFRLATRCAAQTVG